MFLLHVRDQAAKLNWGSVTLPLCINDIFTPGLKEPEYDTTHLPVPNAEVKNECNFILVPPVCMCAVIFRHMVCFYFVLYFNARTDTYIYSNLFHIMKSMQSVTSFYSIMDNITFMWTVMFRVSRNFTSDQTLQGSMKILCWNNYLKYKHDWFRLSKRSVEEVGCLQRLWGPQKINMNYVMLSESAGIDIYSEQVLKVYAAYFHTRGNGWNWNKYCKE